MSAATKPSTLAEALVAAQAALPVGVDRNAKANYGKYVTLDHLIAETRPIANSFGISIHQFPVMNDLGHHVLRTIVSHTSGERMTADTPLILAQNNMQQLGAAVTYARRYAWAAVLGIADADDDDGASVSRVPAAEKEKTRVSSRGRGAAAEPTDRGGSPPVTAAAPAPPDPTLTQERELMLLALADEYRALVPEWDGLDKMKAAIDEHRGNGGWFDKAIAKMKANIENAPAAVEAAAAKSGFVVPKDADKYTAPKAAA